MDCHTSTTKGDLERMLYNDNAEPKALPLSVLAEITNDFSTEHQIGEGAFAVVYEVRHNFNLRTLNLSCW
jgi:hypothetical protein